MTSVGEDQLQKYILMNRNTFNNHPDLIFVKDLQFVYRYVNQSFLDTNSTVADKFVDRTDFDIHGPDKANKYRETDKSVISKEEKLKYESSIELEDENKHYIIVKTPIYSLENEIIGILGIAREITNQVELRETAITNLNLLDAIIDNVPYPIFVKNPDGDYLKVNQAFADRYGLFKKDIIGFNDYDLFPPEFADKLTMKDNLVIESNQRSIQFFDSEKKNEFPYIIIKDVFCNPHGEVIGIVGVVNTLSDLQQVRQKLIQSQKMESISTLIGGIAHDMNNILTNVVGLSSILLHQETSEEKKADLKTILNASQQASDLMSKLLAVDQKGRKKIEIVEINNTINDVISLVKSSIPANITIEKELVQPLMTKGDPNQLSQIIMNIILNAIEAIDKSGKITIKTTLETITSTTENYNIKAPNFGDSDYVKISIRDTGKGIKTQTYERIFDPFFSTKKQKNQGSRGLGLAMVYGIVINHGGAIKVLSTPGEGTEFIIYLPHEQEKTTDIEELESKKVEKESCILIVDDDETVLHVIEKMLKNISRTIITDNGIDALSILKQKRDEIDLAIIDLKMPGMDGLELTDRIRSIYSELPIIISTGYSQDKMIEKLLDLGVNEILHKPYTSEMIISTVDQILS